ncbi:MAG: glycosyltransferase family 4 protein [Bauldia sp.]|nr:glycosyltransferase family 4 protein [Bauldia sp.]
MSEPLRIAIATAGRFHVLDLARELLALGHHVDFYSYVPVRRAEAFGLPRAAQRSLVPVVGPLAAWEHYRPGLAPVSREWLTHRGLDVALRLRLRPCDLLIAMSGMYVEALRLARRRYGAQVWVERASHHILAQDAVLAATPGARRPTRSAIARELAGYALADRIAVPSTTVAESFAIDPAAEAKLFRNPFGVRLEDFPQAVAPPGPAYRLLFVGTWSLRKGCDLLAQAVFPDDGIEVIHVGPPGDCPFPAGHGSFRHVDKVDQRDLVGFYHSADALILPSREEGLSFVQVQALAAGLPILCSDRTGGADLRHTPALAERITVFPHGSSDQLRAAILAARDRHRAGHRVGPLPDQDRATLSWTAYARRYVAEIRRSLDRSR